MENNFFDSNTLDEVLLFESATVCCLPQSTLCVLFCLVGAAASSATACDDSLINSDSSTFRLSEHELLNRLRGLLMSSLDCGVLCTIGRSSDSVSLSENVSNDIMSSSMVSTSDSEDGAASSD